MSNIEHAYERFCTERFPLPKPETVAALEKLRGVPFPNDYRDFLQNWNGGFFSEPTITVVNEECPVDRLTFFSGIGATHPIAELTWPPALGDFDEESLLRVIPVGDTLMGNLILLYTEPNDFYQVCMKIAFRDDVFILADSLEEYFGSLAASS